MQISYTPFSVQFTSTCKISIFSFKKNASNTNVDQFLTKPSSLKYNFVNSPFRNSWHSHIVTGGLTIIKDRKLRKRPKNHEVKKIDFDQAGENIINDIEDCILS